MGTYWEIDGEPGEMATCPLCHGWDTSETGLEPCAYCDGEGDVWVPLSAHENESGEGQSDG